MAVEDERKRRKMLVVDEMMIVGVIHHQAHDRVTGILEGVDDIVDEVQRMIK